MSKKLEKSHNLGVPHQTPTDLPMPPYRFQRDDTGTHGQTEKNGTAKQAADILRQAKLLGCSAATRMA